MEQNNARNTDISLMKGIFEGFIGALFLECTYEFCSEFLCKLLENNIDFAELLNTNENYKEKIMQYFHKMNWKEAQYVEKEKKLDNEGENIECEIKLESCKEYTMYVIGNNGEILGVGTDTIKNKASQIAAHMALIKLGVLEEIEDVSDYFGKESGDSDYYE